ncbi:hypothetical protein [Streptomyces deccanensis]|uniref:hypothetical protein n=1 Tax=Streptomyces deccanensis TaxID=424188 RepID=UPI001EFBE188|nr:hypothetical protein [Streptomyces deccanensis]ULR54366.1 hypothetical protein L3078_36580 [Streptomyces deccanensis]
MIGDVNGLGGGTLSGSVLDAVELAEGSMAIHGNGGQVTMMISSMRCEGGYTFRPVRREVCEGRAQRRRALRLDQH